MIRLSLSQTKVLAFVAPAVGVVSGALAAWLFVHVHIFGIFHVGQSQVATLIASGIVFAITTGLTWLTIHQHLIPVTNAAKAGQTGVTVASVVGLLTPYISVIAGALAAWLFVHVHVLGIFHLAQSSVAQTIASALVMAITAGLTWAAHTFHWLPLKEVEHLRAARYRAHEQALAQAQASAKAAQKQATPS